MLSRVKYGSYSLRFFRQRKICSKNFPQRKNSAAENFGCPYFLRVSAAENSAAIPLPNFPLRFPQAVHTFPRRRCRIFRCGIILFYGDSAAVFLPNRSGKFPLSLKSLHFMISFLVSTCFDILTRSATHIDARKHKLAV